MVILEITLPSCRMLSLKQHLGVLLDDCSMFLFRMVKKKWRQFPLGVVPLSGNCFSFESELLCQLIKNSSSGTTIDHHGGSDGNKDSPVVPIVGVPLFNDGVLRNKGHGGASE
jgi:hypothetical protein